jgi:integrase
VVARTDLPRIRLHDLRHGWATMALSAGVHPKVVQERLGHASVMITLDIYSHVTEGLHEYAANLVGGLIAGEVR